MPNISGAEDAASIHETFVCVMSASALLSVLTGGALNGAPGTPVSDARLDGAADTGLNGMDKAGAPRFSQLMDAQTKATQTGKTGKDVSVEAAMPAAYGALLRGLPPTVVAEASVTDVTDNALAAPSPEPATAVDPALISAPPKQGDEIADEETGTDDALPVETLVVPAPHPVQTIIQTAAASSVASTSSGSATAFKMAEIAAALTAQSADDTAQDTSGAEGEANTSTEQTEATTQPVRQAQTVSSQATSTHPILAQVSQTPSRLQNLSPKHASATKGETSESLAATDNKSGTSRTSAETLPSEMVKSADARTAAPATATDAAIQSLTNDTAPQDTEAPSAEPLEQQQAEVRGTDTTRLSRATVETTAQIAASILRKLEGRTTRFDMVLTPEDLGSVNVSMEIDAEGHMTARLAFDSPAAASEMRARAEELRRQLVEAGFQLSENALEFTDRENNSRGGFQQFLSDERSNRRAFAGGNRLAAEADASVTPVWTPVTLSPSGVDMKV